VTQYEANIIHTSSNQRGTVDDSSPWRTLGSSMQEKVAFG
jgi:hypothetical protein